MKANCINFKAVIMDTYAINTPLAKLVIISFITIISVFSGDITNSYIGKVCVDILIIYTINMTSHGYHGHTKVCPQHVSTS